MSQIRLMLQQELRAFLGDIHLSQGIAPAQPVTDTVTDTSVQAEAVRAAIEIPYVTDTVTDTEAQTEDERVAIRALQAVTDTITDTGSASTGKRKAPSRQRAATDTVSATDTPQSPARRRKRQAAPTD